MEALNKASLTMVTFWIDQMAIHLALTKWDSMFTWNCTFCTEKYHHNSQPLPCPSPGLTDHEPFGAIFALQLAA